MVLHHVWGLFSHPKQEWELIRKEPCSIGTCYLRHVLILAALPAVAGFIGVSQVGWRIAGGEAVTLTQPSALLISIAFYLAMLAAVFIMGWLIHWMAHSYGADPSLEHCVVLTAYTTTPLFLVGLMALYPLPWLIMLVGFVAVAYTIYLFYIGLPILMGISREQGFLFSSAAITGALVILVGILAASVILWNFGVGPVYTR